MDGGTNLYYFNARYYDATIGRFINVDPVQDGMNWYVYCSNNPLCFVDPTGLSNMLINNMGKKFAKNLIRNQYFNQLNKANPLNGTEFHIFYDPQCINTIKANSPLIIGGIMTNYGDQRFSEAQFEEIDIHMAVSSGDSTRNEYEWNLKLNEFRKAKASYIENVGKIIATSGNMNFETIKTIPEIVEKIQIETDKFQESKANFEDFLFDEEANHFYHEVKNESSIDANKLEYKGEVLTNEW